MSPAVARVFEALTACGCNPKRVGDGWDFRCLVHDDHKPSAHLSEGDDGRALLYCQAGCATEAIVERLGLRLADLFDGPAKTDCQIATTYDYTDEAGTLLYQVVRFDPKDFRQRRPDGSGGWTWKLGGTRRVLYGLPGLIEAVKAGWTIYIVEGEKDADAINRLDSGADFFATCNPGGAGKWRSDYAELLRGARVVVIADRDEPGRKHALDVRASLQGIAASVSIVQAKEGKDAADHLAMGYGLGDLVPMPEPGESADQDTTETMWKPSSIAAMIRNETKPRPALIAQIVFEEDVTLCCAPPKSTKSWWSSALEMDAALGRPVLGQYAVPHELRILHIDEEMGKRKIERRFKALSRGNKLTAEQIDTLDRNILMYAQQGMEFASDAGLDELKRVIDRFMPHITVWDSFAAFTSDAEERDNSARRRFYNRVLAPIKAAYGLGIIVLGHPPLPSKDAPADSQKRMRGGGDVLGTCDRSIYLSKDSEEPNEFGKIVRCTLGEYVARESDGLDGAHGVTLEDVGIDADGQRSSIFVSYGGAGVSTVDKDFTLVQGAIKAILHELRTILSGPQEMYQPDLKRAMLAKGFKDDVYQAAIHYLVNHKPPLVKVTEARTGRSGKWVELIPEDAS